MRRPGALALPWLASLVLTAAGLVGGAVFDPKPERPVVHRAGFRVLEGDFHAHTTYSDGTLSPFTLVRQAERRGLDVLGVTEHNTVVAGLMARAYARWVGGPMVLVGEEITTHDYHLIAIGIGRTVSPALPITEVVEEIHRQGGIAIAAHPVEPFQAGLAPVRARLDGTEVMHPVALLPPRGAWRWEDMLAYWEETEPRPAAIGSSDFHAASVLGICRTLLFVREPVDEASVMEALRERRTVVVDAKGALRGPDDLTAALSREPLEPRSSDYAYRGEGVADRLLRALGLLGIVGLVLFRVRTPGAA